MATDGCGVWGKQRHLCFQLAVKIIHSLVPATFVFACQYMRVMGVYEG